jgi:hypothetical protein
MRKPPSAYATKKGLQEQIEARTGLFEKYTCIFPREIRAGVDSRLVPITLRGSFSNRIPDGRCPTGVIILLPPQQFAAEIRRKTAGSFANNAMRRCSWAAG